MIFIDIETIPDQEAIKSRQWQEYKDRAGKPDDDAALHPAFAQIVCIGAFDISENSSFTSCGVNEGIILREFVQFLPKKTVFCGHNIKTFDLPMIAASMLAHWMKIPPCLSVAGKKPWEIDHVDTMELLRFGAGKTVSLDAACLMLSIASPKNGEVRSHSVADAVKNENFQGIAEYCMRDVNAATRVFLRLRDCLPFCPGAS